MAQILSASIDVTKINKSKLIPGKNGAKYLNIQIFVNDEKDQYGNNISVAEGQTKEERERKDKKNYLNVYLVSEELRMLELGELDKIFAVELKPFNDAKVICIEQ